MESYFASRRRSSADTTQSHLLVCQLAYASLQYQPIDLSDDQKAKQLLQLSTAGRSAVVSFMFVQGNNAYVTTNVASSRPV